MEKKDHEWSSGLCGCLKDAKGCCYGFWCCPCLACTVSGNFGENACLPICDILSPAIFSACGLPLCVPPAALSLRSAIRNKYGIKGSLYKDIAISCFCVWCSWCQMQRELKHRKNTTPTTAVNMPSNTPTTAVNMPSNTPTTAVNMQSNTIINVQPGGMTLPGH